MPNADQLKAILETRFALDNADVPDIPILQSRFDALIDAVLMESGCTRTVLLEAIKGRYHSYRAERIKNERRRRP